MSSRIEIPALALLSLGFTACSTPEDPIVGNWKVVAIDGEPLSAEDAEVYDIQMHIDADLSGEFVSYYNYEDVQETIRGDLKVDASDAPVYHIDLLITGDDTETLNCTLTDDRLVCDGADPLTFARQG